MHPTLCPLSDALTIAEAVRFSGMPEQRIRLYRRCGALDAVEINGRHGVTRSSLAALLATPSQQLRTRACPRQAQRHRPVLRLVVNNG